MAEDVLIILVKYPEPGKVKTRLARSIGGDEAARLYKLMAEEIVGHLSDKGGGRDGKSGKGGKGGKDRRSRRYETVVFYDPPERFLEIKDWLGEGPRYIRQSGGDLGERLAGAFRTVFDAGARRAALVGTDCLDVTQETVTKTFAHLREKDVVIGPAADGGYYLIGLSRNTPELFDSIDWSTDKVFRQTTNNIKRLGLSFTALEVLRDVDELADLSAAQLHLLQRKT